MKPKTKQKQPEQKTQQQPKTHGIDAKDNDNKEQIQTNNKELLRGKSRYPKPS